MLAPIIRMLLKTKFGWAIIGVGAFLYFSGFNPLSQAGGSSKVTADDEKKAAFIKKVLATTEDIWGQILPKYGIRNKKPNLVLYRGKTTSGCGFASAQMGPFYCPADQKVYLDLGFFDELARRHNSPGDFAQAYVLAHEIGHHIQNMQGTLQKVQQVQQRFGNSPKANALQVRVELQADCYSGVWAHHAQKRFRVLEPGDINEALRAASSIGDDTLQKEAQGYVVPDSFTHGSSQQRVEWFKRGFISGDLRSCNTFN
jgi:predicted metalloprotease